MDIETTAMNLIAFGGNARSYAFEALNEAKEKHFSQAEELLRLSQEECTKAHQIQTDLLVQEAQGNHTEPNLLMVHAQDHLMTSMLALDLINGMIEIQKNLVQDQA